MGLVLVGLALGAGCDSLRLGLSSVPPYQPQNVYGQHTRLPEQLRRVLLLPLVDRTPGPTEASSLDVVRLGFTAELRKRNAFEVITCTPAELRTWTSRDHWSAVEELPADFLQRLQARTGCDGVLFAELTHFQAYPPLAVGFNLRLVECRGTNTVWTVEETLDAANAAVASGARAYGRSELRQARESDWLMVNSPKHFSQYAAWLLLSTLPSQSAKEL